MNRDLSNTGRILSVFQRIMTVCAHVARIPFIRNIFMICVLVALFFPIYNRIYITPAFRRMLMTSKIENAANVAGHLVRVLGLEGRPIAEGSLDPAQTVAIVQSKAAFGIEKLKLFAPSGRIVFPPIPLNSEP